MATSAPRTVIEASTFATDSTARTGPDRLTGSTSADRQHTIDNTTEGSATAGPSAVPFQLTLRRGAEDARRELGPRWGSAATSDGRTWTRLAAMNASTSR